jgi:hypothetical protein
MKYSLYLNNLLLHFNRILIHLPISRILHRTNSAKLGPPVLKNSHDCPQQRIHFGPSRRSMTSRASQSDSLAKSAEEHHNIFPNRHQRTSSTTISRANREHHPLMMMTVTMNKANEDAYVTLPRHLTYTDVQENKDDHFG